MKIRNVVFTLALGALFTSCENEDDDVIVPLGDYENGILVSNEGPFNNGTGTVSYISEDLATTENTIFNSVNNADLGNVVQSIGFTDKHAYIVANVSNTITVVDRYTFEKVAVISEGLNNPRYFLHSDGKGYVTNWGDPNDISDDFVATIDLDANSVSTSIPVVFGPEKMVAHNNSLYVAHQGAYGQNNTITVIDSDDMVTTSIAVGYVPNSMQVDSHGSLWVLSEGKPSYTQDETAGALTKINTNSNTVETALDFTMTQHPKFLELDGSRLYYFLDGAIYSMSTTETSLPAQSEFHDLSFYSMVINDGRLYGTDAKDFASNGSMDIYELSTKAKLGTFDLGIIPGGIYFN